MTNLRPGVDLEQLDAWCRDIVESHYTSLCATSCRVCLVTDHEFVKRNREGEIISRGSTLSGLALPEPDVSWTRNIGPLGEESHFYSKELNVGAWDIVPAKKSLTPQWR